VLSSHGNTNFKKWMEMRERNLNITHAQEDLLKAKGRERETFVIEYFNKITFLGRKDTSYTCQCELFLG
jgi:hypothetical protein